MARTGSVVGTPTERAGQVQPAPNVNTLGVTAPAAYLAAPAPFRSDWTGRKRTTLRAGAVR
jgi:hypothetical protein